MKTVSDVNHKGRHTTTYAQLIKLEFGGWVVDTPGVRQLQLWDVIPEEVEGFFPEFRPFVPLCTFPDCTHTHEAGCAVKARPSPAGTISDRRYHSYPGHVPGARSRSRESGDQGQEFSKDRRCRDVVLLPLPIPSRLLTPAPVTVGLARPCRLRRKSGRPNRAQRSRIRSPGAEPAQPGASRHASDLVTGTSVFTPLPTACDFPPAHGAVITTQASGTATVVSGKWTVATAVGGMRSPEQWGSPK